APSQCADKTHVHFRWSNKPSHEIWLLGSRRSRWLGEYGCPASRRSNLNCCRNLCWYRKASEYLDGDRCRFCGRNIGRQPGLLDWARDRSSITAPLRRLCPIDGEAD